MRSLLSIESTVARAFMAVVVSAPLFGCSGSSHVKGGPFTGDPSSATYDLDGTSVTLKSGTFEEKTGDKPDDVVATDLTGSRLDADFDGDETTDCAVVVTRDNGTLKVHYLAILPGGATEAITTPLGTNVLVQNLEPDPKGGVIVTMLGRDEGVSNDAPPTVTVKRSYALKEGKLVPSGVAKTPKTAPAAE